MENHANKADDVHQTPFGETNYIEIVKSNKKDISDSLSRIDDMLSASRSRSSGKRASRGNSGGGKHVVAIGDLRFPISADTE